MPNPPSAIRLASILAVVREGPRTVSDISWRMRIAEKNVRIALYELARQGDVEQMEPTAEGHMGRPKALWRAITDYDDDEGDDDEGDDKGTRLRDKAACDAFLADLRQHHQPLVSTQFREAMVPVRIAGDTDALTVSSLA